MCVVLHFGKSFIVDVPTVPYQANYRLTISGIANQHLNIQILRGHFALTNAVKCAS